MHEQVVTADKDGVAAILVEGVSVDGILNVQVQSPDSSITISPEATRTDRSGAWIVISDLEPGKSAKVTWDTGVQPKQGGGEEGNLANQGVRMTDQQPESIKSDEPDEQEQTEWLRAQRALTQAFRGTMRDMQIDQGLNPGHKYI